MSLFQDIRSVAIVGASEDPKKIGNILIAKNQDFSGEIFPINPKGGSTYGHDFYPDFASLPCVPDIAVFAIPEPLMYDALESAGKIGIKKAIIITAGFKEIGNKEGESKLIAISKKYGIRILGPNCLGFGDTFQGLNLSFGSKFFSRGNISIISQSGAMAVAITDVLADRGLGFSSFFSLGNKSDIDESDLLAELLSDPHTEVVALYLESIGRGKVFLEKLRAITHTKPVIIMIGGMSDRGRKASASHTGSLSGDKKMYEAAIRQGGAILTYELSHFFDLLQMASLTALKKYTGAPYIITNAGGIGVLSTDQCDFQHLDLADISEEEDQILREAMPPMMSTKNPIDIIGDANSVRVGQILTNIAKIRDKADILFFFTIQATTDIENIARAIIEFRTSHPGYQIFIGLIGGETIHDAKKLFASAGIMVSESPEGLISTYTEMLLLHTPSKNTLPHPPTTSRSPETSPILLDQNRTEKLFASGGIETTHTYEYRELHDVIGHTTHYHGPYVMKIAGKHIAHKTEIGGVSGKLMTLDEVKTAYTSTLENAHRSLEASEISGVTLGRYVVPSPSLELFFGAKRDANFGETFVIGAGGIYLTVLADTKLHIGAWEKSEIRTTIESLHSYPALTGYRRQKSADMDALVDMIERLSTLFFTHTEIRELDINPILFEDGKPIVADAKVYL